MSLLSIVEDDIIITDRIKPKTGDTIIIDGNISLHGNINVDTSNNLLHVQELDVNLDDLKNIDLKLKPDIHFYTLIVEVFGIDGSEGTYMCNFYYNKKNTTNKCKILKEISLLDTNNLMNIRLKDNLKCEWLPKKNFKKLLLKLYKFL